MELRVCVGSACHLQGAHRVLEACTSFINEMGLSEVLELKACFCQGRCTEGVNLRLDDILISEVHPDTVRQVFIDQIVPRVKGCDG